jgi:hypothetical protein
MGYKLQVSISGACCLKLVAFYMHLFSESIADTLVQAEGWFRSASGGLFIKVKITF